MYCDVCNWVETLQYISMMGSPLVIQLHEDSADELVHVLHALAARVGADLSSYALL